MAFALAPWLEPPNFLDAIRSGAQLGLGVRNADLQQQEAAARQQQAMATLQQNWAEKVMANQTAQQDSASRDALAQQQLGYRQDLAGMNNTNAQARIQNATDALATKGDYLSQLLDAKQKALDAGQNKPMHLGAGSTVYNPQTGEVLFQTPPTDRPVNPLSDIQQADQKALLEKTAPVVTTHWFKPNETNAPPPLSQSDQAKLQFYQNRDAALIRQNPIPNAFPLQTNSLAPAADAWLGEGNTGNNPPQLSPPLSLNGNPAAGTMALPHIGQGRADAISAIAKGAPDSVVRQKFQTLYGEPL